MEINLNDYEPKHVIKIIRGWAEMTQAQFAESVGLKKRVIQTYECGSSRYTFETLQKIAKIHRVTLIMNRP